MRRTASLSKIAADPTGSCQQPPAGPRAGCCADQLASQPCDQDTDAEMMDAGHGAAWKDASLNAAGEQQYCNGVGQQAFYPYCTLPEVSYGQNGTVVAQPAADLWAAWQCREAWLGAGQAAVFVADSNQQRSQTLPMNFLCTSVLEVQAAQGVSLEVS